MNRSLTSTLIATTLAGAAILSEVPAMAVPAIAADLRPIAYNAKPSFNEAKVKSARLAFTPIAFGKAAGSESFTVGDRGAVPG
ncbi:MAG: hypothetical protein ACREQI_10235 [Candidatus Binataceae bacterium]